MVNRLCMINEETSVQQMPRRRSNSLPIPKIEVSIYQSPENKKKDVSKDFMEVPEVRDVSLLTGTFVKILTNFVRILIKCFIFFFFVFQFRPRWRHDESHEASQ